jgi:hypothetical protein
MASGWDPTGVRERGMASEGELGDLGEPGVSLSEVPAEQGYRLIKSPGAGRELPPYQRTAWRDTKGGSRQGSGERATSEAT